MADRIKSYLSASKHQTLEVLKLLVSFAHLVLKLWKLLHPESS